LSRLDDWARERAPELLEQAEREAVALLRDALIAAALPARARPASTSSPAPRPEPRRPKPEGEALWAYCVLRSAPADVPPGVDPRFRVEAVEQDGLVALVSRVPLSEFGEEPLRENLNDLTWLERVARAHEAVLEGVLPLGPMVPLRLCTIYTSERAVREMLVERAEPLREALDGVDGRNEWGVKLIVTRDALAAAARECSPEVAALQAELDARKGGGGAYMLGRRLERTVADVSDRLAAELADDVHLRLSEFAADATTNPPQNRELSGHEGDMLLNGAYLVEADRTAELERLLRELEERHGDLGASLELTGPWPPYNFVARPAGAPA
jgi:hypothetical protein